LRAGPEEKPSKLLYLIIDSIVDSYFVSIDHSDDRIDEMQDSVLDNPSPQILENLFDQKRKLIELRRVLVNLRDACMSLQRESGSILSPELYPFFRDVYDHSLRLLDMVETLRDLLNSTFDVYLSSVANRTNQVMKVLTVLSTIALPALVISGIYGMNLKGLPFLESDHGTEIVVGAMAASTGMVLWMLKRFGWL
jgi:magnesium transporter